MERKTIRLTIPATIEDVTLGHYIQFLALTKRIHAEEQRGVTWSPRKHARHILSVFSGVDAEVLGDVDEEQFQNAFARLGFLSQLGTLKPRGEYTGGTFEVKGESFVLPESLDHITAGQYEVMERTLNGTTTFDVLHYVLAILSMWDTPNILAKEAELHRRAKLFAEELPLMDVYDIAFFLPVGSGKMFGPLTLFCMSELKMKNKVR